MDKLIYNFGRREQHAIQPIGVWVGMVRFCSGWKLKRTELFDKFKITEPNRTVCISNWTEPFQNEPNYSKPNCYYWYHWKNI